MSVVVAFAVTASRAPRGIAVASAAVTPLATPAMVTTTTIRTTGTTGGAGCGGETD